MHSELDLSTEDVESYMAAQEAKGFLRFITCGSVDDGNSILDYEPEEI